MGPEHEHESFHADKSWPKGPWEWIFCTKSEREWVQVRQASSSSIYIDNRFIMRPVRGGVCAADPSILLAGDKTRRSGRRATERAPRGQQRITNERGRERERGVRDTHTHTDHHHQRLDEQRSFIQPGGNRPGRAASPQRPALSAVHLLWVASPTRPGLTRCCSWRRSAAPRNSLHSSVCRRKKRSGREAPAHAACCQW